jgi:hypothetical protein
LFCITISSNRFTPSRFPNSGGQYYWVAVLAPRSWKRFLSYATGKLLFSLYGLLFTLSIGWLCVVTWQTSIARGAFVAASLIQGLFVLNIKSYESKRWHGSLLMLGFILAAIIFNTLLARKLPMMEGIFVLIHILGIVILVPQLILLPRSGGAFPFIEFYNSSGWSSNGLATMVGASGPIAALIGFDCSVHMGTFSS